MRIFLVLTLGMVLAGCAQTLPRETFRQPEEMSMSSSLDESILDLTNEAPPKTIDSLEVTKTVVTKIPVRVSEKNSIILGDTGSGTIRGKNPPTLKIIMDYGCEFCLEEALTVRHSIIKTYVAPHHLNLEILFAPKSLQGTLYAKAAICSAKSGFFEEMNGQLLLSPNIDTVSITKLAQKQGVKAPVWKFCMDTTTFGELPTAPDGSTIVRLPAFILGEEYWIGVETEKIVKEKIEKYLLKNR